jgi:hypothetical protein
VVKNIHETRGFGVKLRLSWKVGKVMVFEVTGKDVKGCDGKRRGVEGELAMVLEGDSCV